MQLSPVFGSGLPEVSTAVLLDAVVVQGCEEKGSAAGQLCTRDSTSQIAPQVLEFQHASSDGGEAMPLSTPVQLLLASPQPALRAEMHPTVHVGKEDAGADHVHSTNHVGKAGAGADDRMLLPATPRHDSQLNTATSSATTATTTRGEVTTVINPVIPEVITPTAAESPVILPKQAPTKVLRRSTRTTTMADERTLDKAERLKAKKNLDPAGTSFSNLSDKHIISNLGRVGINLGPTAVVAIKNLEVDRLVLHANKKR